MNADIFISRINEFAKRTGRFVRFDVVSFKLTSIRDPE